MKAEITAPQTGTQTEAIFLGWTVKVGDRVSIGDVIGTIETDKATVEIEAGVQGVVVELLATEGEEISVEQVLGYLNSAGSDNDVQPVLSTPNETVTSISTAATGSGELTSPLSATRKRIAESLLWVSHNTARASTTVEVDFEAVAAARAACAQRCRSENGLSLTFLPFVALAACQALQKFPQVQARIDLDSNVWTVPQVINLGIAVAHETGLTVPIISDAGSLSFLELATRLEKAAIAVRDGTIRPKDAQGGTLTITNPGSFGSFLSQPIMNRGETSILCIDGISKRAVVLDDAIVARYRSYLTLAFDHRIVDGSLALRFLNAIKASLEGCDQTWIA
jgi:2-oxoglutarate dehydrogenase E2 component (dihydrolipoamide succinyltransferase)